jgi:uncharacterized protein involved in outer membrane biogenesis
MRKSLASMSQASVTSGARPLSARPVVHRRRFDHFRWIGPPVILLALIVAFFVFLFQWNWLRGPLADWVGAGLHRKVTIQGDLHVQPWSWTPSATVDGVTIGNPSWAGPAPMARISRLSASLDLPKWLEGQTLLPLVSLNGVDLRLQRAADGRANWDFGGGPTPSTFRIPSIHRLVFTNGRVQLDDQARKLRFAGTMTSDTLGRGGPGAFVLDGAGSRGGQAFAARLIGAPLADLGPSRPYPFRAWVRAGVSRLYAEGALPHPFDLSHFQARVEASGNSLYQLSPLIQVVLPRTPPYQLTATLTRAGRKVNLADLGGRFGDSDISGGLDIDDTTGRRRLTGNLLSHRARLADLAALIGGGPRRAAGHTVSPEEAAETAKLRTEHRLLPDVTLNLGKLRDMDADVTYQALSVDAGTAPVRDLKVTLDLDHGVLTVSPLAVGLLNGQLTGLVRIDARGARPAELVDLRLAGARLEQWVGKGKASPPLEGELLARLRLSGSGDSVREAAGDASGGLSVVVPHGEIRRSLAELLGIDVADGAFLLLTKSEEETPVRCAVADFHASDGLLTAQQIVLDTGVVLSTGSGTINLRDETLKLRLDGKPKKFRLLRIGAPILVTGNLESPKVGVDVARAAPQLALAGALGFLVGPLAAVLPFVNPGLAHDADCSALLAEASSQGAPKAPLHAH